MAVDTEFAAPSVTGPAAMASADDELAAGGRRNRKTKKKIPTPEGFEDHADFLRQMREEFAKDEEYDKENRDEAVEDLKFLTGEQWDPAIVQRRSASAKPTLTINRLPAFVGQITGNRRLVDTGIKIIPDADVHKPIARIREGLIRSIQKFSRAQHAYDVAFEHQVISGLGNFQVHLEYANDDVFEQDIRIAAIPNPLSVVWDRTSVDPTGADADHVFVVDTLTRKEFERRYPERQAGDIGIGTMEMRAPGWNSSDSVRVVSYWRMISRPRTLVLMQDGSVRDVTGTEDDEAKVEEWWNGSAKDPDGFPIIREVHRRYAQMHLCSSNDILDGPYELPIQRVPVLRVPAWEVFVENERKRWGLVRFLRDPQRLHNYWRSTIAEKLVGAPRAKWVASEDAVRGHEREWRESHLKDDPLLIWNGEAGAPPQRVMPVEMEAALIQEAGMAAQDIRDVSNIHEANLGQQSNEVSGRAIMARQRVGEVGSVIYQENLNAAIEEAGKIINQLIPFAYDTARTVVILGPDMEKEQHVRINDLENPESVNITEGKYTVSVTTGPSYTTRRVEAREEMMGMINAMPDMMAVAADKIVEAQDWPGQDEIAARLRSRLPPGMISPSDLSPEEQQTMAAQQQAAAQQQQIQQAVMQLEMAAKQAEIELTQAKTRAEMARGEETMARAQESQASAMKAMSEIDLNKLKVISEIDTAQTNAIVKLLQLLTPDPAPQGAQNND